MSEFRANRQHGLRVPVAGIEVGVDIGGTTTRAVAFDAALDVVATRSAPSRRGPAAVVDAVATLVDEVIADTGIALAHVGIGVPGRVDAATGVVGTAVNLGLDHPVALADDVAARLDVAVHVENDVNAAALGAYHRLGLAPATSLAYVNVGTGIAAGVVLAGELWRGARGGAGEIGHVPRRLAGPDCVCGQIGCAEAMASGRVVAAEPERAADVLPTVAWAVQLCAMTLDVDVVAVGGGMTERAGFADELATHLRQLERSSAMLGAAALADRYVPAPAGVPLGAMGAVLAARRSQRSPATQGGVDRSLASGVKIER